MALAEFHPRRGLGGSAEHLYVRALAVVEQAPDRDPRRRSVLKGLASLYRGQGRREEASGIERVLAAPNGLANAAVSATSSTEDR
jgi:hypothetical protein